MRLAASTVIVFALAANALAQEASVKLDVDGKPALVLVLPNGAKVASSNAFISVKSGKMAVYIWAAPDAKVINDVVPRIADLIKSEFVNFQTKSVKDITLAGAPAKDIKGSGNEADDGDPGNAEVVIFERGDHVFASCIHGEFDDAAREREPMMALLQSAQAP